MELQSLQVACVVICTCHFGPFAKHVCCSGALFRYMIEATNQQLLKAGSAKSLDGSSCLAMVLHPVVGLQVNSKAVATT